MISPFTGGEVVLCQELREIIFRNEKFSYMVQFYVCVIRKSNLRLRNSMR